MAKICQENHLIADFESLSGLDHTSLRRLLSGRLRRIPRVDPQGFSDALFLLVQYLYEKSERMRSVDWRQSERLKLQAERLARLHNDAFSIPSHPYQLDGPIELLRPKRENIEKHND